MLLTVPMPKMRSQVYVQIGSLPIINPNCGWYCAEAMLAHWYQLIFGQAPKKPVPLPCKKLYGWDPYTHYGKLHANTIKSEAEPNDIEEWGECIGKYGPIIASGELAEIAGRRRGHFVLIVGVELSANALYYKDPLNGDKLLRYNRSNVKFNNMIRCIDRGGAVKVFDQLGVTKMGNSLH